MEQLTTTAAQHPASQGFALPTRRSLTKRHLLTALRPESSPVRLDLDLIDIVAELDPGMIDWEAEARSSS
ncbi:MAG: hypothetical protein ACT4OP_12905 [Actinomycetota bacterium]